MAIIATTPQDLMVRVVAQIVAGGAVNSARCFVTLEKDETLARQAKADRFVAVRHLSAKSLHEDATKYLPGTLSGAAAVGKPLAGRFGVSCHGRFGVDVDLVHTQLLTSASSGLLAFFRSVATTLENQPVIDGSGNTLSRQHPLLDGYSVREPNADGRCWVASEWEIQFRLDLG